MPIIKIKTSTSTSVTPSGLAAGEMAYNIADDKLWVGNGSSSVLIKTSLGSQAANAVSITGGSINNTTVGATTPSTVTTSNLQINGSTPAITLIDTNTALGTSTTSTPTQLAVSTYVNSKKGALKNMYTFTSSGTYTKSGTDVNYIRVVCVGAGGGAAQSYGESGGAGGYSELLIAAGGITTVPVTVSSSGGAGGGYYGNYNAGGTTSFGGYCSASGGYGANNNMTHSGGYGGLGYGGNINSNGGGGSGHRNMYSTSNHNCGHGGASFFGGGIESGHYGQGDPWNYANAALGAGGVSTHGAGVTGQGGVCIVYEYK
jgi:hypothetical protein